MSKNRVNPNRFITLRSYLEESGMRLKKNDYDALDIHFLALYQAVHGQTYYKYGKHKFDPVYSRRWLKQLHPLFVNNQSLLSNFLRQFDGSQSDSNLHEIRYPVRGWFLRNYHTLPDRRTRKLIENAVVEKADQAEIYI